jgi:S-adenosyl-methyltransferase MraW
MIHIPVLLNEVINFLNINPNGVYIDGTVGGGGHSYAIAKKLSKQGKLICIDQDDFAIKMSQKVLYEFKNKVDFFCDNFYNMKQIALSNKITKVDGILLDLGVSSFQIDDASRGFSYMHDAQLDMRMNKTQKKSAYDIINSYTKEKLCDIMKNYGDERFYKQIANKIVKARKISPIKTTLQLVEIIKSALPNKILHNGGHFAKKTFQAIRIEVNNELDILNQTIIDAIDLLNSNSRLCIITFHSLEDRIVKHTFNKLQNPCDCPRDFPICICGKKSICKVITKKPIYPTNNEMENNPRSHSAKLRVVEKI